MMTFGHARTIRHPDAEWTIGIEAARISVLMTAAILGIIVVLPALLDLAAGR